MVMMSGGRSQLLLLVLFVAVFCLLLQGETTTANDAIMCKESERQALLDFKQSLQVVDRAGFEGLSSWDGKDCCAWMGVLCNSLTGYVEMLQLSGYFWLVAGTISPSLLKLQHLSVLDLSQNDFNGTLIPDFIGSLKNLTHLDLSLANFRGPIPSQLGNLSKLEILSLGGDFVNPKLVSVGNLEWLSHLTSLKYLDLSFTNLSKASDWSQVVNQLPFLGSLTMKDCDLPSAFSSFLSLVNSSTSLTDLDLSGNYLTSSAIYPWLFNVSSNLEFLDLSRNHLKGPIPESFGNMVNVVYLSVSHNQIEGGICSSFWSMCSLKYLGIESNHLSAFGFVQNTSLCAAHSLEDLTLAENQLMGSVPNEMANLSSLITLDLGYNHLNGTISKSIGQLSDLRVLQLAGNSFDNVVISEAHFSNLTKLKKLDLSYSSLTLKFNSDWIPPFQLHYIFLCSCKLGPRFPEWLRTQAKVFALDISAAKISDSLSISFWDFLGRVKYLNLSFNQINADFNLIDLSNNQFSGVVPDCFAQFPNLIALNLADNNLSGPIPNSLGSLASLQMLNLRDQTIEHLLTIVLSNPFEKTFILNTSIELNYVDEALLMWKGTKQMYAKILGLLFVIDLSGNKLTGEIPEEITSLRELVALNLSRNLLSGKIPLKIGQLRQLQSLDLSRNNFSGCIPPSLSELTFIGSLDLSYNYLSGKIPTGSQLQLFDPSTFSHNHGLCGPPVTPNCSMETPQGGLERGEDDFDEFMKWFYAGMGLGFAVGFWGFCGAFLLKRSWRHSYFRFLDKVKDWLYVTYALQKARLERRIQT
ncbi:Leucine-rich repeat - like 10 [Theobroma cacao]|nr:Leucine-rich repeat - like 10 [Theobroma cacao]